MEKINNYCTSVLALQQIEAAERANVSILVKELPIYLSNRKAHRIY
jgi:hypothetical protein